MWTWEAIETEWLHGDRIAYTAQEAVEAFNLVERTLGRAWMKANNNPSGADIWGAAPTASIVRMGLRLASLEGLAGRDDLIARIKRGDVSALAELTTIHILRSDRPLAALELGPDVTIGSSPRKPDFRVRGRSSDPWTYVEVTQTDTSDAEERLRALMARLVTPINEAKKTFGLEVFLRREPNEDEIDALVSRVRESSALESALREELPQGLGLLLLNHTEPGRVVLDDHGEPHVPRLGLAQAIGGGSEPHRHIAVRMAYSDERAERFFGREARQLPKDAPGLLVIQMSRAPGGFKSWEPLIRRRFQPTINTRVSAVCFLGGGSVLTPDGEKLLLETKVLVNPHAAFQLPQWITDALTKAGEELKRYMPPEVRATFAG